MFTLNLVEVRRRLHDLILVGQRMTVWLSFVVTRGWFHVFPSVFSFRPPFLPYLSQQGEGDTRERSVCELSLSLTPRLSSVSIAQVPWLCNCYHLQSHKFCDTGGFIIGSNRKPGGAVGTDSVCPVSFSRPLSRCHAFPHSWKRRCALELYVSVCLLVSLQFSMFTVKLTQFNVPHLLV